MDFTRYIVILYYLTVGVDACIGTVRVLLVFSSKKVRGVDIHFSLLQIQVHNLQVGYIREGLDVIHGIK